jgi:arabinose-5-phosphate isomerase
MKPSGLLRSPKAAADLSGIESARRVLALEARGIDALARSLGPALETALALLSRVKGRVVVTGMGKSGHVARKIAATLSSTGTPAFFVHPAEASHGDLGMIAKEDALFVLSNSGETAELADVVAYATRFGIPLIAVTARADSALAKAATVAVTYPASEEACPLGLAPTTSTTVMLALGDAVAVALLERKGFTSDQFQALHPGGRLGRRLLKVQDLMHVGDEVPLVGGEAPMADAIVVMTAKSFGCLGIVGDDGRLQGVITDGDLRRHMGPGLLQALAREVMTKPPRTIAPQALATEAVRLMNAAKITNLFAVEDGRPVGILHIHDCLRAGVA